MSMVFLGHDIYGGSFLIVLTGVKINLPTVGGTVLQAGVTGLRNHGRGKLLL